MLHDGARALLIDPAAAGDLAVWTAAAGDSDEWEAAAALMSRALDEARMALENGAPEGAALIEAVGAALSRQDAATPFAPTLRLRLAQIYARAGLAPPSFAQLTAESMGALGAGYSVPDDMPDIGAMLDTVIREAAGAYLRELTVFDVYVGEHIDPTRKSLAVGLTFQNPERTLGDEEVAATISQVVEKLKEKLGAALRG